jgi:sulfur carrier protein
MKISINGFLIDTELKTLLSLLNNYSVQTDIPGIAVAVNDLIIKKNEWIFYELKENDNIELITAMQGG